METDSALAFLSRLVMFVVLLVLSAVFLVLVFRLAAIVLETMVRLFSPRPKGVISRSRMKAETEAEIKSDMERINSLSVEEAEGALRGYQSQMHVEPWISDPAPAFKELLSKLDPATRAFLAMQKKITFAANFASYSIEHSLLHRPRGDMWVIGDDGMDSPLRFVCIRTNSPVVYEVFRDGKIIDEYPSIFHYILTCDVDR